jgi:hypothetical protein
MNIQHSGSQPSSRGAAGYFTGRVRIDPLFASSEPARATGASATTAMTHIAIQDALDRRAVVWPEQVSDDDYQAVQSPE